MSVDFIPVREADLGPFATNMAAAVGDSIVVYGITSAQNAALQDVMNAWGPTYDACFTGR